MSSSFTDAVTFVLPACAPLAATVAAFVAFLGRREAGIVAVVPRPHTADLMTSTGWFGGSDKRNAGTTSYDPQSRGSSG